SINQGSSIAFRVGTSAASYDLEVYRMGWYDGAGARLITAARGLAGVNPVVPLPDPTTGLIEAQWPAAYTLSTNSTWVSGTYLTKLIADTGAVGYIVWVLRDDADPADIVVQVPFTTY